MSGCLSLDQLQFVSFRRRSKKWVSGIAYSFELICYQVVTFFFFYHVEVAMPSKLFELLLTNQFLLVLVAQRCLFGSFWLSLLAVKLFDSVICSSSQTRLLVRWTKVLNINTRAHHLNVKKTNLLIALFYSKFKFVPSSSSLMRSLSSLASFFIIFR